MPNRNAVLYVALCFTGILWPAYIDTAENVAFPLQFGEVAIMLWLIIMGARPALSFARRSGEPAGCSS